MSCYFKSDRGLCNVLTVTDCETCRFRKTAEQVRVGRIMAARKLRALGQDGRYYVEKYYNGVWPNTNL